MSIKINCFVCKHYNGKLQYAGLEPYSVCRAFPQGIPKEILEQEIEHTTAYPGDGGITFEKVIELRNEPQC